MRNVPRPEVPVSYYELVGRVTTAFAHLDVQLGMCGWTATTGELWTEDWTKVAGKPGQATTLCRKAVKQLPRPLSERLAVVLRESERLRLRRHQLTHGALIFDPETTLASSPFLLRDARGVETALVAGDEGHQMVAALHDLAQRASAIRHQVHSASRAGR